MTGALRCGLCRTPLHDGGVRCSACGASLDEMFASVVTSPTIEGQLSLTPDAPARPAPAGTADGGSAEPAGPHEPAEPVRFVEVYRSPSRIGHYAMAALVAFTVTIGGWVLIAVAHRRAWADSGSGPVEHFGPVSDLFSAAVGVVGVVGLVALTLCTAWLTISNQNLWAISAGGRIDRWDLRVRCWPVPTIGLLMGLVGLTHLADSWLAVTLMIAWSIAAVRALSAVLVTLTDLWWRTGRSRSWPHPPGLFRFWTFVAAGALTLPLWSLFLRADPNSIASRDLQILAMVSTAAASIAGLSIIRVLSHRQDHTAARLRVDR